MICDDVVFEYYLGTLNDLRMGYGEPIAKESLQKELLGRKNKRHLVGVYQLKDYPPWEKQEREMEEQGFILADKIFVSSQNGRVEEIAPSLISLIFDRRNQERDNIKQSLSHYSYQLRMAITPDNLVPEHSKKRNILNGDYFESLGAALNKSVSEKPDDQVKELSEVIKPLIYCHSKYGLVWTEMRLLTSTHRKIKLVKDTSKEKRPTSNP